MAPLSFPLSSLLKLKDCAQKANIFCNVLQGLHHRPLRSRLWKRNFGAVAHGVGQLLSHQPRGKSYAASVCSSSSDGQDMTDRLWSVYNETKKQTEDLLPVISTNSVNPNTIFANNEMSLRDIEIYGFDYDYTLAFYSRHLHTLIFDIARDILITNLRYPEGLRNYEYIPDFAVRGLHYDVQKALLMKIDAFHYIQLGTVYRGLHPVPDEEVIAMYEGSHVPLEIMSDFYGKSSHGHTMKQFMDIFSLPEMTLLSCVNDFFMRHNIDYEPVHLYKDVKEAIRDVHVKGIMYRAVEVMSRIFVLLRDRGMHYIVGKDWMDLFDVVIVQADKPGFFNDRRKPFRRVTDKGALLWDRIHKLEKGKIYKQGNLYEFLRLTGWRGSKVLYFGDHIYSDLADLTLKHGWRTGAIIPELRKEIKIMNTEEYMHMMAWLQALTGLIEQMQVRRLHKNICVCLLLFTKDIFNGQFGSLFRTYHNPTYFSRRLSRFADIYMASISCLLNYDFQHTFFPRRTPLQHESPFWPEHSPAVGFVGLTLLQKTCEMFSHMLE
uniref:5'-nucleotidase domain-containing protein 3 n=1 Tax=Dicentrarchus labrax TaxID=13489 RepID=A0A8P4KDH8_DICLA